MTGPIAAIGPVAGRTMPEFAKITPEQAALIRQLFDAIWPVRGKLADRFYQRFFALAPDARALFPGDMEHQSRKLMDMISAIVGALEHRELFRSIIQRSGRDHGRFGAKPQHFEAFGEALIGGLQDQFGPAFTAEQRDAWLALYAAVQHDMLEGARH